MRRFHEPGEKPMSREARVRLDEDWRYLSREEAADRLPSLANALVPGGRAAGVLVPAVGDSQRVKLLPGDMAGPIRALVAGAEVSAMESGLRPEALRALELEGVLRVTPPVSPARDCVEVAADDDSISVAALTWGATFRGLPAEQLTRRLYFFGRRPVTPQWSRRLPDERSVARWLGLVELQADLEGFRPLARTRDTWVWRRWVRSRMPAAGKLYVCCVPQDLPSAVRACIPALRHPAVTGFKLGFDLPTVLRPDKFILFLADLEPARELAERIASAFGPAEVHPLPFTAAASAGGIVSMAADPDDWAGRPATIERASWRLHVCRVAAETLVANRNRSRVEQVAAALERLGLAGVDTCRWTWQETS